MVDDFLVSKYGTAFFLETAQVCGFSLKGGNFGDRPT
jgi:hypothetical protein